MRKKRRDRSSDKARKSHKRKERHRSTTSPPVNDGEGLEEIVEKRHKKKKRKHSRSDKDLPNEAEPTVTMDTVDKASIGSEGDVMEDVLPEDNSSEEGKKSVQDPSPVEGMSPTGTCTSGLKDNALKPNDIELMDEDVPPKPSQDGDTDTLSGGSTPLLAPPLSPSDSASLLERPSKHSKKRKRKHKIRSSEKKSDKDRRRHKKHRSEREGKGGSHEKSSSRKKSRRRD